MLKGLLLKITVHQGRTIIPVARAVIPAVRTVIPAARKIMAVLEGGKRGEGGHEQVSSIGNSNYFTRIASYVGAIRGRGGIKCIFHRFGADLSQAQL